MIVGGRRDGQVLVLGVASRMPTADQRKRGNANATTLLAILIAARDPESDTPALTGDELVDQAVTMYWAGTESTAGAVNWSLHLTATHPAVRRCLAAEITSVLGGRTARWDGLTQLPYICQDFTEALRMYPPGWFLTRRAEKDAEPGPYAIPRGTTIAYSPYLISRLPGLCPDPLRFVPDRWELRDGARPQVPLTVFGGARKCIGVEFSMMEGVLAACVPAQPRGHPTPRPQPADTAAASAHPGSGPDDGRPGLAQPLGDARGMRGRADRAGCVLLREYAPRHGLPREYRAPPPAA